MRSIAESGEPRPLIAAYDPLRTFGLSLFKVQKQGKATCQELHGHGLK
jgi:hypothetical protein